jgi:hypothetical protein
MSKALDSRRDMSDYSAHPLFRRRVDRGWRCDDGLRRVVIRAMPTRAAAVRGPSASLCIRDEAAHSLRDTGGPADERRIIEALNGCTTAFGAAAKHIWITTPFGESGSFYESFQAAEAGVLSSTVTFRAATWEMRPDLPREYFEAQRLQLGEDAYRQEYGAEFRAGGSALVDLRRVEFSQDGPARPEDCDWWVCGLDPAFHSDRFGVALVGRSRHERGVLLVGPVDAIEPKGRLLSFDQRRAREDRTLQRVAEILEPYRERGLAVITDQHQSDAVYSHFGRMGLSVQVVNLTQPTQAAAFVSMRTRLYDGSLAVLEAPGADRGFAPGARPRGDGGG